MQQRRWVSYIYRYRDKTRCEIAGFLKIQRIINQGDEQVRIRIGLKMYKGYPCSCTAYLIKDRLAYPFTSVHFAARERDTLLCSVELPWSNPLGDGVSFTDYEGVYFLCDDGEELAGVWDEKSFRMEEISPWKGQDVGETVSVTETAEQMAAATSVQDVETSSERNSKESEPSGSKPVSCQELLQTYPKLPLFAGSQILDGVKIVPQDIGKLGVENWKLGVNSFLSHGYYKYRYLMLGRVRLPQRESYVIGVPGIFTNKEKYLANMFGFRTFIPVKKTKINTGSFGYWIYEVSSASSPHSAP